MKKLLFILICITTHTFSQIKQDEEKADYTVTGSDILKASRSITLKPTTWIKAGANFHAFIVEDAYLSLNLSNENYILTRLFQTETTTGVVSKNKDVIEEVTYFDGLGRAKQSIGIKQSPNKKDIVTHIEYDEFGRQAKDFLPYGATVSGGEFNSSAKTATNDYYKANYPSDIDALTANPYSEKQFDGSPLNRVLKQAAPGKAWKLGSGHEIKFDYQTNISGEVKLFGVTTTFADNTYTPTLTGGTSNYVAGELYKMVTKDENWTSGLDHTTEEFKNKEGQVILKRTYNEGQKHDTYYVYDDFGNLTYVLPPKAEAQTDKLTTTELNELCYQYVYDHRNRLVEKKIPGKGREYIIYDKLDRPIWTQDKNQRDKTTKEWLFTKYDAFGRVVYTGKKNHESERTYLQNIITGPTSTYKQHENRGALRTIAGVNIYYTSDAAPTDVHDIYTINYYDDYNVDLPDGLGQTVTTSYGVTSTSKTKGLATVSKVKVLGSSPAKWITTVTYYDKKARPIYVYSKNDELGTTDIIESKLDFSGKVLETKTTHTKGSNASIVTIESFEYDHMGRVTKQTQKINSQETETIVTNEYDELGQLKSKKIGGNLQKVDYKYNIRGWLKDINQDDDTTDNDLFNFTINYNNPQNGATPLFNGNISETSWNTLSVNDTPNNPVSNRYVYSYDALNRIIGAKSDASGNYSLGGFDASGNLVNPITYDKNGNIKNLTRNGYQGSTVFTDMDVLSYDYGNTNQLNYVTDGGNNNYGFKDGNKSGNDFEYDSNGNMIIDRNKGITNITYNHLNLPVNVTLAGGTINYTYGAAGNKLRKTANSTTTEYAGNYKYVNGALQFFNHSEGYVQKDGSSFSYVYQYKDHLGNVRLSYTDNDGNGIIDASTEIIEESNYYPFGLKHKGYNGNVSSIGNDLAQKWGYNGKEYQDDLVGGKNLNWHDFGARNYDAALGRWMNLDPLAEQMRRHSPYNFAFDNPVYYIDPDGMAPRGPGDWWRKVKQMIKSDISASPRQWKKMKSDIKSFFSFAGSTDSRETGTGDGFSYVTDDGSPTGQNDLIVNTTGDVTEINVTGIMTMKGMGSSLKGIKEFKAKPAPYKSKSASDKNLIKAIKNGRSDMKGVQSRTKNFVERTTMDASNTAGEPTSTSTPNLFTTSVVTESSRVGTKNINGNMIYYATEKKDTAINFKDFNKVYRISNNRLKRKIDSLRNNN